MRPVSTNPLRMAARRRMAVSLSASSMLVVSALLLLPGFPAGLPHRAGPVLVVTFSRVPLAPAETRPEAPLQRGPAARGAGQTGTSAEPGPAALDAGPDPAPARPIDWYAALAAMAGRSDELLPPTASLSPALDEARRLAAERYGAPRAAVAQPAWENVEPDQLGRKVLRHGNCYRVLEDNAVTRRWVQENFTQYLVFCESEETDAPIRLALTRETLADFRHRDSRDLR